MIAEKTNAHPETPQKAKSDSSIKFFRFIPYRPAMKVPEPIPRVPIENLRSRSMRELRLASRIMLTLELLKRSVLIHFIK